MRSLLALAVLTFLAGCSGDPRSFGITGPGNRAPPPVSTDPVPDTSPTPGVTTTGPQYGPTGGSSTGNSGFWGYN